MRSRDWIALAALLTACAGAGAAAEGAIAAQGGAAGAAERIYREGILPSGEPLRAVRENGMAIEGKAAACSNCHRRSGIGVNEGRITIPPITAKYLLNPDERLPPDVLVHSPAATGGRRESYTDETLVRAIREGINADGKPLSYLMPRFALNDADAATLVHYLRSLSREPTRGVTHDYVEFATIVTPDADSAERAGMIDVLQHFFSNKNDYERLHDPPMVSARRVHYRVVRKWRLHVWELSGPPDTWEAQLNRHLEAEPVFAVISGVGGRDWAPVHRFCEHEALPCLFPNVQLPVVAEGDFYPLYFSRGVLLEADLIRGELDKAGPALRSGDDRRRVVQIYRRGDVGEAAAHALRSGSRFEWIERPLPADGAPNAVREALADVRAGDTVVLWLRGGDLRALPADPPNSIAIFASGLMAGLEQAPLPANWRGPTRITYPVDLPQRRSVRLVQPLTWFRAEHIPVVAERVQVDTYIACQVLSEGIGHAFGDLVPDYLIEQIENMVSVKLLDGYYRRLALAPGQRFASKGGYIVRLAAPPAGAQVASNGTPRTLPAGSVPAAAAAAPSAGVIVDTDWIVP
ncbi:MAG: c-type cytochrome [Burkholderiaceae bacterium]|nr:c-type cytochrome [Burkholderiaceae bacterium]